MKKRIGAILLTICMLVGLLPATALAAETVDSTNGYQMTLDYDAEACTITVLDKNNSNAEVADGGYLIKNNRGEVCGNVTVTVNEGYRIKSAALTQTRGTTDLTEDFITGVFGWKPMLYASSDFTLKIVTEEIPEIPSVTGIQLYSDEARTTPIEAGANLISTEDSEPYVYVKATYSDGKEYPVYTARGYMEYSLDGTTWETTEFGGFYHYFPVDWCQYETKYDDTSTAHENYDFRIRIEPDDMYCTGGTFYSEVYHVNGGVDGTAGGSGDSGSGDGGDSGDSGDSGSGGETGQHKLAAPVNLNWHRFYDYNSNDDSYVDFKGLISWQIADTEYDQTSRVVVYKDGEDVFQNSWTYRAARGEVYQSDWDFSLSDYGSGTYQFTVQACGDGETTEDSVVATSDPWVFTAASTKLAAPETAWSSTEPLTATWTSSTEALAGGYQIEMYYSSDNANATSTADLDVVSRFVYYTALDGEQTTFGYDQEGKDGYYYFQVRAISSDESQARHSDWSGLSAAYAYGVGDSGDSGETETGCLLTFKYPENLCKMYAENLDEEGAFYYSGDRVPAEAWLSFNIDNITDGYRIKSVMMNGNDRTKSFVNGAYGGMATTIRGDVTIDVELELIPKVLPSVNSVTLYMDSDFEQLAAANVTVDGDTHFYGKADYSDGVSYPAYYIGGVWEYTTDGTNWEQDRAWGSNRFDYWPGWTSRENFDPDAGDFFVNGSYDLRLHVMPKDLYTTGADVLSNVIHINGGASAGECEHSYNAGEVTTAATCTEDGVKTFTCVSCGDTYTETIGRLGHAYAAVVTAPTCTEQGYTTHTCSRCGDSYKDTYVNALQHDWDEGVITTEPTEDADGVKTYTCQRSGCGATKTETVSKLAKQEVSWFLAGPITWPYGRVASAQNTAYNDTVDGGALTYTSSDERVATVDANGKATIVGAGTVQITATAAAVPGKYAETSASYTLVINKAPLTVTANNASITYGQTPANDGWTASGFVYDDSVADVTGTAAYTYTYEQFGNAGAYAIHVSGLTADNYDITYVPGTLTVNKAAEYTITLGNLSQREDAVTAVTASVAPQDATAQITVEYLVNEGWTSDVPTAAGEYQVRASLASSDNIAVNGAYTSGTLVVERSVAVDDTDVSVTVDGEKAEILVTDEELDEIVNNVDGEVAIDLSGVTGVTELALPGDLMGALSESDKADGLTVTTGDASISMSGAVLDTVARELTGEDTVTVKLTAVEENELNGDQQAALDSITQDAVIVEVALVITHADGSTTELHELGGNVAITVPFEGEVPAGKYIVVCYLSDDGNVTYLRATYDAEKKQVTFNTNHFSNYAVFVSGDPMAVVNGGSGSGLYAEGATVTIKAESKSGYRFNGWEIVAGNVTLADANKAETTFVMPAEAVELTATYRKNNSGGGSGGSSATYSIKIEDAKHGEVTAASKTASKGDTVTLTVDPDAGYTLETLTVTDKNGKELKLTKKGSKYTFTMPAGKVTVAATFMEDNSMLNFFVDVPADAYYYDAVLWAAENEITGGTSATTFSPDRTCTRAQAVTFLWRAAGSPAPESESMPFADVPADAYYYDAVLWAVEQGITAGTSETTFSPDMKCTRAQIVTFLWRAQKTPAAGIVNPFADVANDAYYAGAVIWALEQGITAGTSADAFSPNANCTRAQIVTFLWRCMGE